MIVAKVLMSSSLFILIAKVSPSPLNAWLSKCLNRFTGSCEGLSLELPGPLLKLGSISLFCSCMFTVHEWGAVRLSGPFFYRLLYIAVRGDHDFSLHSLFSSFDALAFTLMLLPLVLLSFDFFIVLSDGRRAFSGS
jgi:hypothetical protein